MSAEDDGRVSPRAMSTLTCTPPTATTDVIAGSVRGYAA